MVSSEPQVPNERPVLGALGLVLISFCKACVWEFGGECSVDPQREGCEDTKPLRKPLGVTKVFSDLRRSHSEWRGWWIQGDMMGILEILLDPQLAYFSPEKCLQENFIVRFHGRGS